MPGTQQDTCPHPALSAWRCRHAALCRQAAVSARHVPCPAKLIACSTLQALNGQDEDANDQRHTLDIGSSSAPTELPGWSSPQFIRGFDPANWPQPLIDVAAKCSTADVTPRTKIYFVRQSSEGIDCTARQSANEWTELSTELYLLFNFGVRECYSESTRITQCSTAGAPRRCHSSPTSPSQDTVLCFWKGMWQGHGKLRDHASGCCQPEAAITT